MRACVLGDSSSSFFFTMVCWIKNPLDFNYCCYTDRFVQFWKWIFPYIIIILIQASAKILPPPPPLRVSHSSRVDRSAEDWSHDLVKTERDQRIDLQNTQSPKHWSRWAGEEGIYTDSFSHNSPFTHIFWIQYGSWDSHLPGKLGETSSSGILVRIYIFDVSLTWRSLIQRCRKNGDHS
jgi:hypothetical protein